MHANGANSGAFEIGRWRVHPRLHRIEDTSSGRVHQIEPKIVAVLVVLVQRAGEVVSRDELLDAVWPGVHVTDRVLTRAISELRKVFEDDSREPAVIETIVKGGYRFVGTVEFASEKEAPPVWEAAIAGPPRPRLPLPGWALGAMGVVAAIAALSVGWMLTRAAGAESDPELTFPLEVVATRPFTSEPNWEYDAALSPDGQRVAYVWNSPETGAWEIWTRSRGVDAPTRVTRAGGTDGSPTWSPDGSRIAYYRYDPSTETTAIYISELSAGSARRVSPVEAKYPDIDWSPNGERLVLTERATESGPLRVVLLELDTGERTVITDPPSHVWGDHYVTLSPDGSTVAFVRTLSEALQDIYTVSVDGGAVQRITHDGRNVRGVTWSADGGQLLFGSTRGGTYEIWRVGADGPPTTPQRLGIGRGVNNPTVRGQLMIVEQWESNHDIVRLDIDGSGDNSPNGAEAPWQPLVASTYWDMNPAYSPDGLQIAFTSNRSGAYEIWVAGADGSSPRRLTSFDGPYVSTPRWSPDGADLVFEARPEGNAELYAVPAKGGALRRLTNSHADDLAPVYAPDGGRIYFTSARSGEWQIWALDLPGGEPRQITLNGGFGPQVNSTGSHLYFTRPGMPGVWKIGLEGGPDQKVLENVDAGLWGSWTLAENGIYYVRFARSPLADVIVYFDWATGSNTDVAEFPLIAQPDAALALSPDGRTLLVGVTERSEADLLLVDLGSATDS